MAHEKFDKPINFLLEMFQKNNPKCIILPSLYCSSKKDCEFFIRGEKNICIFLLVFFFKCIIKLRCLANLLSIIAVCQFLKQTW
jgi:hypothetical protein